jgi:hypothetical protein
MNVSIDAIISALSAIVGITLSYGIVKAKITVFEKEIDCLQEWKDKHIEDQNLHVREIEKEISELRGMLAVGTEQYKEILRRLTVIEIKMEERRSYYTRSTDAEKENG